MIKRILCLLSATYLGEATLVQIQASADQGDPNANANLSQLTRDGIHLKAGEQVMVSFTGLAQTQYD